MKYIINALTIGNIPAQSCPVSLLSEIYLDCVPYLGPMYAGCYEVNKTVMSSYQPNGNDILILL